MKESKHKRFSVIYLSEDIQQFKATQKTLQITYQMNDASLLPVTIFSFNINKIDVHGVEGNGVIWLLKYSGN